MNQICFCFFYWETRSILEQFFLMVITPTQNTNLLQNLHCML